MSLKVSSLIEILRKIDSGEQVNVHSLMNDLRLSERTVHRYLDELSATALWCQPLTVDK